MPGRSDIFRHSFRSCQLPEARYAGFAFAQAPSTKTGKVFRTGHGPYMSSTLYDRLVDSVIGKVEHALIEDCAIGRKCAGIHTRYGTGLAFVSDEAWREAENAGPAELERRFRGRRMADTLAAYPASGPLETTLALAALNSFHIASGEDDPLTWFRDLRGKKRLGMVGYFCPIMDRLALTGIVPVIFELRPLPGTHRPEEAADLLPGCDAVLITGAAFVNKTVDHYLPYISPEAEAYIFGHSTPLADELLDRFTLGSSRVLDKDTVFEAIRQGGGPRDFRSGVRKVIRRRRQ